MTNFEYTVEYNGTDDFTSSWVDAVYYNENDQTAVVDLSGQYYLYKDVPESAIANLVHADSVGNWYNTAFKMYYGPGTNLGIWYNVPLSEVTPTPDFTPKALEDAPTKEFSLDTPEVANTSGSLAYDFEVFFNMDGAERSHVVNAESVDEAYSAVTAMAGVFGVDVEVTKVVVEF